MRSPGPVYDLRAALSEEVAAALSELNAAPTRPKSVHACRVRLKRARALARVGGACAPGLAAVFNETARAVMRALAQARDLAALAGAARDIAKKSDKKGAAALRRAADNLDAARLSLPPVNIDAVRAGLKDLHALAQVWPEASPRQIEKGARRIALRARVAARRGHGSSEPARRHAWRKREKDRLYAATLLDRAWPGKRRRKRSARLAEALGRERDALLLIDRLEGAPGLAGSDKQAKRALKVLAKRCSKLAARADALGDKLHAAGV